MASAGLDLARAMEYDALMTQEKARLEKIEQEILAVLKLTQKKQQMLFSKKKNRHFFDQRCVHF